MSGEIRQFFTREKEASIAEPKTGDLVKLTYRAYFQGQHLNGEARVVGRTMVATIKEIATDTSRLVVRTRQPDKPENEINIPLQVDNQFQPLVSAMRPGDGINATFVRDGGVDAMDGINHVKSLEWQSKPVGRGTRWFSLIGALYHFGLSLSFSPRAIQQHYFSERTIVTAVRNSRPFSGLRWSSALI